MQQAAAPWFLPGVLCSDYVFQDQLRALAQYDPVAVNGYGNANSLAAMAEHVLALAPERVSLAGHSMGARVALEIVRRAPQRVERLALLDTGVQPPQPGEREKRMSLLTVGREEGIEALVDRWLPPMVHPARRGDTGFMRGLRKMAVDAGVVSYESHIAALLGRPDAAPLLGRIECPVLVGVGRQDEWSSLRQHEAIAAAIPGAVLAVFEDSGHMSPVEAPQQVNEALLEWLKK